jgi:hypothetical protein
MRTLTDNEKEFLINYTDECEDDIEKVHQAVNLIRDASIQSLCEVVLHPKSNSICSVIAHYLNDNADRLGFTESVAVEKMARVKRAPYAINQFILNPAELTFIEKVQTDIIEKVMQKGFGE